MTEPVPATPNWKVVVRDALEAARVEVVRRLREHNLPLTILVPHLTVVANSEGTGWQSGTTEIQMSGLVSEQGLLAARDDTVDLVMIGLRDQLSPLAEVLDRETDLGSRPFHFLPAAIGAEAILVRYVQPIALEYLRSLPDLAQPDEQLAESFVEQLQTLVESPTVTAVRQLAIGGVTVDGEYSYRNVTIRPLTNLEQGLVLEREHASRLNPRPRQVTGFVPSSRFSMFMPTTLLETKTKRERSVQQDESTIMQRLVLALLLLGHPIASNGLATQFDESRWASFGVLGSPIPVLEKHVVANEPLTEKEFRIAVGLAETIPEFTFGDTSTHDIVLHRVLRGCGAESANAGFLDCVISLEAALLGKDTNELSYKFKLYGAVFLRDELDPKDTFDKLGVVYKVRSKLVHGSPVKPEVRQDANAYAQELARAVALKAVRDGWPNTEKLDQAALGAGIKSVENKTASSEPA